MTLIKRTLMQRNRELLDFEVDPSLDWSWYDPRALEGFEDRIVEAYAPYRDLPPHYAGLIASAFAMQRAYVNRIASGG